MPEFIATNRFLFLKTPLGPNDLLLAGFSGHESISRLFEFSLDLLSENAKVPQFDRLIGQKIGFGVEKGNGRGRRCFHGIVNQVTQGGRDNTFTRFQVTIVPQIWILTQKFQSRIFQHLSIPDILKKVLDGYEVAYELQGDYQPRDYCVQYRETDFAFISRLMEEEGIFYYFKFSDNSHKLVIADSPQTHQDIAEEPKLLFEGVTGGLRPEEERITSWEKVQEWHTGKYTMWDHCFELPGKSLEAQTVVQESVVAGKVTHKLKLAGNEEFEDYDYPGRYANRFDGIDKGGGEQASEIQKIFKDNKRTVQIRMQQGETRMMLIRGESDCRFLTPGYKFTLQRHYNADGTYTLVSVHHDGAEGDFQSSSTNEVGHYGNTFTAIPFALPFRPQMVTPRPYIRGCQTAVVVGPAGEEIFTDKYGRVKVQFQWDREGKGNADSSCWLRVATPWAGKKWGMIHIPRIGHEVVVEFMEGDPDHPIIIGSVYNADHMTPWELPANKTIAGLKTHSSPGGSSDNFNELSFEDKKGHEMLFMHAEKDMDIRVKNDRHEWIGNDRHLIVGRDRYEEVQRDCSMKVARHRFVEVTTDEHTTVGGKKAEAVAGSYSLKVDGAMHVKVAGEHMEEVGGGLHLKAGSKIVLDAGSGLTIKCGGSHITLNSGGVYIHGDMVYINSGGSPLSPQSPSPVKPTAAKKVLEAMKSVGGMMGAVLVAGLAAMGSSSGSGGGGGSSVPKDQTHDPNSEENKKKDAWIEIELLDANGKPATGVAYKITVPDGTVNEGTTDEKGQARIEGIDPGSCKVTFPELDKDYWSKQ